MNVLNKVVWGGNFFIIFYIKNINLINQKTINLLKPRRGKIFIEIYPSI